MSLEAATISESSLLLRQAQERTLLQAEVQKLKKEAAKGDKKKKLEISSRIAALEAELDERHDKELTDLPLNPVPPHEPHLSPGDIETRQGAYPCLDEALSDLQITTTRKTAAEPKKPSKAQKRKEKKSMAGRARDQAIEKQEAINKLGSRHVENEMLLDMLSKRGLELVDIPADGDCLYRAVQDQLQRLGQSWSIGELRKQTAAYMKEHSGDFLPFMTDDSGQMLSDEAFLLHCQNIETTSEWGGQPEICALSHILRQPLEVIQAEGISQIIGEEYSQAKSLILIYHRHLYGLGEHYSSATALAI